MPLDTIYLTRHGSRLNYTVDPRTGIYRSSIPTPTGNPVDPCLTSHGVRQSHQLAAHVSSPSFHPKPYAIYSSPFYRCLQTIQPSVEALRTQRTNEPGDLDVRIENGIGEWFGQATHFTHPPPCTPSTLRDYFPSLLPDPTPEKKYTPHLLPSPQGESIAQLHNRLATTLQGIISDLDAEIAVIEAGQRPEEQTSKAVLIVSHAAPLIAMGRVLTGHMPQDPGVEDFHVFTAGLSTFTRKRGKDNAGDPGSVGKVDGGLAPGTRVLRPETSVPDWQNGRGVGGGWDCVGNGDCSFLSSGAERGWHFNGEESFDTEPLPPPLELQVSGLDSTGSKL